MRVVIVDDQERFRSALAMVVELTDGMTLAGRFASVAALRQAIAAHPEALSDWSVVLMDLEMPGENGLDGLRLLKSLRPDLPVVMCTVYDDGDSVHEAIRRGADGYLLKSAPLGELLGQLTALGRGGAPLAPKVARGLLDQLRSGTEAEAEAIVSWLVAADGSEVVCPGGKRLDLRRRQAMRLILAALARARVERPGQPLSTNACIEAGWPGERMARSSAQARLWTSIRTLRSLGLAPILETVGDGYRLTGQVQVRAV